MRTWNCSMRQSGFTLIELLVVVSIIALLIAILLPSLSRAQELARVTVCASNQRQLHIGLLSYAQSNQLVFPPFLDHEPMTITQHRWMQHPAWGYQNLGLLHQTKMIEKGKVFFCPSQTFIGFSYENYAPWPTPGGYDGTSAGTQGIRSGFQYNPHRVDPSATLSPRRYTRVSDADSRATLVGDMLEHQLAIAHRDLAGWNLLAFNGSVQFKKSRQVLERVPAWWDLWLPVSLYDELLTTLESK